MNFVSVVSVKISGFLSPKTVSMGSYFAERKCGTDVSENYFFVAIDVSGEIVEQWCDNVRRIRELSS